MDTPERLQNWLKSMGYQGKMPEDFTPFCNPSTAFIWEQVMQKVKPKSEVARIRNTLLINRCSSTSDVDVLKNKDKHPIKELETWKKKQSLKKELAKLQQQVNETKSDLDALTKFNQMQHLKVDAIRGQIQQTRNCTHILNRKRHQLEAEINESQELLTRACRLTPVEGDTEDATKVSNTLTQCTLHLQRMIEGDAKLQSDKSNLSDELSFTPALACSSFKEDAVAGTAFDSVMLKDRNLQNEVQSLFQYNRHDVWDNIHGECEIQTGTLKKSITSYFAQIKEISSSDPILPSLYGAHIEVELNTIQVKSNIAKLEAEISRMDTNDMDANTREKQEEYGLSKAIQHLQKLIDKSDSKDLSLAKVNEDLVRVNKEIVVLFDDMRIKADLLRQVYQAIQQIRNNTGSLAKKLGKYTLNNDWLQLLNSSTSSREVALFLKYPLDQFARSKNDPFKVIYDSNELPLVATLFPDVWSPPELMLLSVIRAKEKLQFLKSLTYTFGTDAGRDAVDFQREDSYINYALDKLKHLILSGGRISQQHKELCECVELWLNMPMKNFVSPKRMLTMSPYNHYEELYERSYKKL